MFVSSSKLKKLMKEAWEHHILIVARDGDVILIQGSYWIFWSSLEYVSNQIKAAVVEFAGTFPDKQEAFRAGKGEATQYEFTETLMWKTVEQMIHPLFEAHEGKFSLITVEGIEHFYRVFVPDTTDIRCFYVQDIADLIVSDKELAEGEERPCRPSIYQAGDIMTVYQTNYTGLFCIFECKFDSDDIRDIFIRNVDRATLVQN